MIQIQLQPEIEAQLAAEARARGMAIEEYIVEKLAPSASVERPGRRSISEAVDRIREMRKGESLGGLGVRALIDEGRKY
jgi:hypothetical protein